MGGLYNPYTLEEHGVVQHTDVTRGLFIPANEGFVAAGTPGKIGFGAVVLGGANVDEPYVNFRIKVPDDFVSFTSSKVVWLSVAGGTGNMYWKLIASYGASGEAHNAHSDTPGYAASQSGGNNVINVQELASPLTLTSLAKGDYIGFEFRRIGSNGSDTLDAEIALLGLLFTYVAHQ